MARGITVSLWIKQEERAVWRRAKALVDYKRMTGEIDKDVTLSKILTDYLQEKVLPDLQKSKQQGE